MRFVLVRLAGSVELLFMFVDEYLFIYLFSYLVVKSFYNVRAGTAIFNFLTIPWRDAVDVFH